MKTYLLHLAATLLLPALLITAPAFSFTGPQAGDPPDARTQKIRQILRIQDLRTPHDGALREYLYDPDTLVRRRAVLACGSLQDTSLIYDLLNNLKDAPLPVQTAAAFAIGQTASLLSPASLGPLEHDLVWVRLDMTEARGRLIEEMGKFGTAQALSDLMHRLGTRPGADRPALLMSIARFAIRKITDPDAVRFTVDAALEGGRDAWMAAYALQRIGADEEIRRQSARLAELSRHPDPLVRMNFATLIGKLASDSTPVEPLAVLAESDDDWRVRVNALKALGSFSPVPRVMQAIGRSLRDGNPSIVLTALAAFGGFGPVPEGGDPDLEAVNREVGEMAANTDRGYAWQIQVGAAKALAATRGEEALGTLRVPDDPERLLRAGMIDALGATGSVKAEPAISAYLGDGDPLLVRSSLEALHAIALRHQGDTTLRGKAFRADVGALSGGDMAVITTAASNLGDSLFMELPSAGPLIATLDGLRVPDDIEPIQEICRTLVKAGARGEKATVVAALERLLERGDAAAALASAQALTTLTGEEYLGRIPRDREPLHTDFDFDYLEALPDTIPVIIETIRGEIRMELYRDIAPFTIMSMLKLAGQEGYYRGLIFHRVVPNFVIQGGDPRGDGWGGPGFSLRSEFSPLTYSTGTVGIASAGKDTEGSQFFITHSPQPHLDGRYTIIGRVVSGMAAVDAVQVGDRMFDFARTP